MAAAAGAAGRSSPGFGLTEPGGGSDAGATQTTAKLESGEWVINGSKAFITNSGTPITEFVTVTAVTDKPTASKEISAIIVPNGTPGFEVGKAYRKMGWHHSDTHELSFNDCRVPEENLLGERGEGFKNFLQDPRRRPHRDRGPRGRARARLRRRVPQVRERAHCVRQTDRQSSRRSSSRSPTWR